MEKPLNQTNNTLFFQSWESPMHRRNITDYDHYALLQENKGVVHVSVLAAFEAFNHGLNGP